MPKADSMRSMPPTNTSAPTPQSSRRGFLVQATGVAVGGAAIGAGLPLPAPSTVTAQSGDAELIELGARFEPLLDQYYVARKRWSGSFERDHTDYLNACNALSALHDEMKQLANAINAAPVTSIEGLRAKALVAFWEIAPLCATDTEFSFDDEYPFQQLFTAIAECCGLKEKIVATGYTLPAIGLAYDDSDDDCDDEAEGA
jgi:hypothetical protein